MKTLWVHLVYLISMFGEFWRDMRAQKKRTALTIFGIVWGTAAVVIMMAVGTSTKRQNITNFRGLGDNIILIFGGTTTKPYQGFGVDRPIRFQKSDAEMLRREIPEAKYFCGEYANWNAFVRYGKQVKSPLVSGVPPHYWDMRNTIPRPGGRFINRRDMDEKRRVMFLGNNLKDFLFGEEADAVGEFVYLDGVPFRVIGVLEEKVQNSSYNRRDEERAFIPFTTFEAMYGYRYVNNLLATSDPARAKSSYVVRRVREVLGKKYVFDPTDEDAVQIWDTAEFFDEFYTFFNAFNVFLVVMGAMTLSVGGLGVSNIMHVVVRERTREIGIKRAVGAKRWVILLQFFAETFFIVSIGAIIGFLIAWGITAGLAFMPEGAKEALGTPIIDPLVALVSIGVIALVGFLAGFFPARRASRLDPVECINY